MYKQTTLDAEPSVLLDPNTLSTDGTVALSDYDFSEDGNLLAYSYSKSGSDWHSIKIRNVETGKDYPDLLERIKFSKTTFTNDNEGFFYAVNETLQMITLLEKEIKFVFDSSSSDTTTKVMVLKQIQMSIKNSTIIELVKLRKKIFWLRNSQRIHRGECRIRIFKM